jgi:hypothetical protein
LSCICPYYYITGSANADVGIAATSAYVGFTGSVVNFTSSNTIGVKDISENEITEKTISQSMKARDRVSKEMYQGVQLDRKLAPHLRQAASDIYGD